MNLVIDIGNSQTKVAVFDKGEILQITRSEKLSIAQLEELKGFYRGMDRAILSSVAGADSELAKWLKQEFDLFINFDHQTAIPIENLYEPKETLGLDRIAAAVGGNTLFPEKELLIIDAGTAITFDIVDNHNRFTGGNISPGLAMRFRALHKFTQQLPEIASAEEWPFIGQTTEQAIRAGIQNGMIFEIDGMIGQTLKLWPECQVILTGGDSFFFEKKLKNAIFVKYEITLIGLNRILEYNAEKK